MYASLLRPPFRIDQRDTTYQSVEWIYLCGTRYGVLAVAISDIDYRTRYVPVPLDQV